MGDAHVTRAAPDLEGAVPRRVDAAHLKACLSHVLRMTSPTRPPGGGRARPGVNPGGRVEY